MSSVVRKGPSALQQCPTSTAHRLTWDPPIYTTVTRNEGSVQFSTRQLEHSTLGNQFIIKYTGIRVGENSIKARGRRTSFEFVKSAELLCSWIPLNPSHRLSTKAVGPSRPPDEGPSILNRQIRNLKRRAAWRGAVTETSGVLLHLIRQHRLSCLTILPSSLTSYSASVWRCATVTTIPIMHRGIGAPMSPHTAPCHLP
ncbi:hypothetical protein DPEC_G00149810 [Dallia pectoralis]|uniref:Uncharacterized protein n=1 Tax=Dallia pectoralis TaxID=75939 RepID=A0ACC2GIV1_DALPE|nr:hypothetical protein DPEC_G00149810 [Dallia pectoralis]